MLCFPPWYRCLCNGELHSKPQQSTNPRQCPTLVLSALSWGWDLGWGLDRVGLELGEGWIELNRVRWGWAGAGWGLDKVWVGWDGAWWGWDVKDWVRGMCQPLASYCSSDSQWLQHTPQLLHPADTPGGTSCHQLSTAVPIPSGDLCFLSLHPPFFLILKIFVY